MNNNILIPKQPFMVKLSPFYNKFVMGAYDISHFYEFRVGYDTTEIETSVPDGCIDLIFHADKNINIYGANFYGTSLLPHAMKITPDCSYFGVRFLPGRTPVFIDAIMSEMVDNIITYDNVGKIKNLSEKIFMQPDFMGKIQVFFKEYMKFYVNQNGSKISLKDCLVDEIIKQKGNVNIVDLSLNTGYSTSYIDKIFSKEIGISPKKFSTIVRFQWLMSTFQIDPTSKSIFENDGASSLGYYDQSHLIHDFKKFSGRTPEKYRNELLEADYLNRLKIIENIKLK